MGLNVFPKYLSLFLLFPPAAYAEPKCSWEINSCKTLECTNMSVEELEATLHNVSTNYNFSTAAPCSNLQIFHSNLSRITKTALTIARPLEYQQIQIIGSNISFIQEDTFSEFKYLRILVLAHNKLESVRLGKGMEMLEMLDLSYNRIEILQGSDLPKLAKLTTLKLQNNQLLTFQTLLCNFGQLEELYASYNNLITIKDDFRCNHELKIIDLANNKITISSDPFCNLTSLKQLHLNNNYIKLQPRMFCQQKGLFYLDMEQSEIGHIPEDAFIGLSALAQLNLRNCTINSISNGGFRGLENLTKLDMGMNALGHIDDETFVGMPLLKELLLDNCRIHKISLNTFSKIGRLTYLNFTGNKISRLQKDVFRGLKNISDISLKYSNIAVINVGAFDDLWNLTRIDLSYNSIQIIDTYTFNNLSKLVDLILNNNRIISIGGSAFYKLDSLKLLNIQNNPLVSVREYMFLGLKNLNSLNLSNLLIDNLGPLGFNGLDNLETLDISSNQIKALLSYAFFGLSNLKELILNKNDIAKMEPNCFKALSSLKRLTMSRNELTKLKDDSFLGLIALEALDLSYMKIRTIEYDAFSLLDKLEMLNLTGNRIKVLQGHTFSDLPNLRILELNNPLQYIDVNVFARLYKLKSLAIGTSFNTSFSLPSFAGLKNLKELDLRECHINILGTFALVALPFLESLKLPPINVIETGAFSNAYLHYLNGQNGTLPLNGMEIQDLKAGAFLNFQNPLFYNLDLSCNKLARLYTQNFEGLENLKYLHIQNNTIAHIAPLSFFCLEELLLLNLTNNKITTITNEAFRGLTKLQHLDLHSNLLSMLSPNCFSDLKDLQFLDLSVNRLVHLENSIFTHCVLLAQLNISFNKIASIDPLLFSGQKYLKQLYINSNEIRSFNASLFLHQLLRLEKIDLNHNNIPCKEIESILRALERKAVDYVKSSKLVYGVTCKDFVLYHIKSTTSISTTVVTVSYDTVEDEKSVVQTLIEHLKLMYTELDTQTNGDHTVGYYAMRIFEGFLIVICILVCAGIVTAIWKKRISNHSTKSNSCATSTTCEIELQTQR